MADRLITLESIMATTCIFRLVWRRLKLQSRVQGVNYSVQRHLLSDAYLCQEAWKKRLNAPELKVPCNEFLTKLFDKYEKDKMISVVDISILVNKISELDENDLEMVESLLYKFRHCRGAHDITDSLAYSLVRCYIEINKAERLIPILKNKVNYGIFPNYQTANILMDHFIKAKKYNNAAEVAYEMMLQEDFSHRATALLSLYSCIKHFMHMPLPDTVEEAAAPPDEDEEENWIKLSYINKPYYDDHFDITEPNLLLGKTLVALGKVFKENTILSNSLQVVGWALYEKFDKGLIFLESCLNEPIQPSIYEEVILKFEECLKEASIQDPSKIQKELGLLTKDDIREELKVTAEEKEAYLERFKVIFQEFKSEAKLLKGEANLKREVDDLTLKELPDLEKPDIEKQIHDFLQWESNREHLLKAQIEMYQRLTKRKEIEEKLLQLQEKEEILTFFESKHKLMLAADLGRRRIEKEEKRAYKPKSVDEFDEDGQNIQKGEFKKKKI